MKSKITIPKVGDVIYIEGEMYLSHGADDILGGKVTISDVEFENGTSWIKVKQYPTTSYNWEYLKPMQDFLREKYKDQWSKPNPDLRSEFNQWD